MELVFEDNGMVIWMTMFIVITILNTYFNGDFRVFTDKLLMKKSEREIYMNIGNYYNRVGIKIFFLNGIVGCVFIIGFVVHNLL